jgi:hypothetical protein
LYDARTSKIELKRIPFVDEESDIKGAFENYKISFLNFDDDEPIRVIVHGKIMNSVGDGAKYKAKAKSWKQRIAKAVGEKRKGVQNPKMLYAISVTMHFHPATHGNQELDAENFLKPILDATAAGLFADENKKPEELHDFRYDDSNFENVYFDRMWVDRKQDELIIITISKTAMSKERLQFEQIKKGSL